MPVSVGGSRGVSGVNEITAKGETGKLTHHVYNVGPSYKMVEIRPSNYSYKYQLNTIKHS